MLVETYEVTETSPETGLAEFEPETLALIEELGLEGQRDLIRERRTASGDVVRTLCPYREMTAAEQAVYSFLLPKRMDLERYDRGPIPLRVLQVAALAKREGWFPAGTEVWCPESAADKDPLLVGLGKRESLFILARWGDELEAFEVLAQRAARAWVTKQRARLQERLASIESDAARKFGEGDWVMEF